MLFFILLSVSFAVASSLECYSCTERYDCTNARLEYCPAGSKCYSVTKGNEIVHLGCSYSCHQHDAPNHRCRQCTTDFCNRPCVEHTATDYGRITRVKLCDESIGGGASINAGGAGGSGIGGGAGIDTGGAGESGIGGGAHHNDNNPGIGHGAHRPRGPNRGGYTFASAGFVGLAAAFPYLF